MKAGNDITDAVHSDVSHVEFTTGVGKHGQYIELLLRVLVKIIYKYTKNMQVFDKIIVNLLLFYH